MLNRTPQSRETLVNCLILATALKYIFRLNDLVRKLFIPEEDCLNYLITLKWGNGYTPPF